VDEGNDHPAGFMVHDVLRRCFSAGRRKHSPGMEASDGKESGGLGLTQK